MEHLALEIFDLPTKENPRPTGSKYANLPEDSVITITDTSEIFESGDVWSQNFTLNVHSNAHIFGTSGDIHGSRLHEQINKRRARLWVEGLPLFLGYLMLEQEVEVDEEGNVDVRFESGQKTFEELIDGTSATEVSVGDVVIGVAMNRKRVSVIDSTTSIQFTLDGLEAYAAKDASLTAAKEHTYEYGAKYGYGTLTGKTPYVQRWPKLVKSKGEILDSTGQAITPAPDYTNIQTPYDSAHPFCNINICYPLKVNDKGEEKAARGYTLRLARGEDTTDGGDNQTRFNNAPNFYLLYWVDRLFGDMGIHITENQAKDVEDLRRVFMLNYGCHYEELEDEYSAAESESHATPEGKLQRYGQYYIRIIREDDKQSLLKGWDSSGQYCFGDVKGLDHRGKVLLRNVTVEKSGAQILSVGSIEGIVQSDKVYKFGEYIEDDSALRIDKTVYERPYPDTGFYSSYLAYATGENYPHVEIKEIIDAMKSMFGVRLIFSNDYSTVRIVLLRNIFKSKEVQHIECEIEDADRKVENSIRGFRMTYGKGTDNTSFYYKGFNDLFQRAAKTWKDTADKHDYSQWNLNADYDEIKQYVSAFNRMCYITPVNGNAYGTQVDEDEDVLFPSLFEWAGFMDAEDGDCTGESETIEEIQCGATPLLMNEVGTAYASLFTGEMKAPAPEITGSGWQEKDECWSHVGWLATYGRITPDSLPVSFTVGDLTVAGDLDIYIAEGFRIRLLDNYAISNGGTPFDEADPGLCFGIMRSSGADAYVRYYDDIDDEEGNDAWDVTPGSGAVSHPDSCDSHGNEWDYDGSIHVTPDNAQEKLQELFPTSDAPFYDSTLGFLTDTMCFRLENDPEQRTVLIASAYSNAGVTVTYGADVRQWMFMQYEQLVEISRGGRHMLVEIGSSQERGSTLVKLCRIAYGPEHAIRWAQLTVDNGVGSRYGRFSLKLRAEKMNPYFDPSSEESLQNRRYLQIENENLQGRGLLDTFYKELSYWVRNARIISRRVHMQLSQLLSIDKTKRVTVGDVMGFIRKIQYSVSNKTGLGEVIMEIMYI